MRETCPHCHAVAIIRTSDELSPTGRRLYCRCTNAACGHYFVAHAVIVCTLSPAARPNPAIWLPMSPAIDREALMQQLRHAPRAPGEAPRPKTAADSPPEPQETAPASAFKRTTRPALPRPLVAPSSAASLPGNTWHPAPGFTLPEYIGRHLAAEAIKCA
jgi:hypothetical protein